MSMFSGFTNQISGWVATKTGAGGHAEEDPNAVPQQMVPENGAEMMGEECNPGEGQVQPTTPVNSLMCSILFHGFEDPSLFYLL